MRIHSEPLKATLEATARLLDRQGIFGKAPASLRGKSMTELLDDGTVHFAVDEKYPQALGINSITHYVSVWANSHWEILHNDEPDTQFLTSDFPVAIGLRPDEVVNRLVPLAPGLAVRILHGRLNNSCAGGSDLPVAPFVQDWNHPPTLYTAGERIASTRRCSQRDHRYTPTCRRRGGRQTSPAYTARGLGSNLRDDHPQLVRQTHWSQLC
jgi:hypothetical protein